jgi:hypothetical protein
LAQNLQDRHAEMYVLSSLCETYLVLGRDQEAEEAARAALELGAPFSVDCAGVDARAIAWGHYRLGKILHQTGKNRESRVHLEEARSRAAALRDDELLARLAVHQRKENHA